MLRYVSPVRYFGRVATRDVELRGHTIRANDAVVPYYAAANRDPEIYADPQTFDVERRMDRTPHVAFSYGTHFCAGARLARLEAHVIFEELLKRFPNYEQAGDIELEPNVMLNATLALPIRPA
jgi:cytochrome P450